MARGDQDPRPPIEIVRDEPDAASVQVVTTRLRRRSPRSRRRVLVVGAGVVALLVSGLLLGSDDDGPATDTTPATRRSSTTTGEPTTTVPAGSLFGEEVGAGLLTFGGGGEGWELIDLDTGTRTHLQDLPAGRLGEQFGTPSVAAKAAIRAVRRGIVIITYGNFARAQYYGLGPGGAVAEAVDLGPADLVLGAGRSDRVWLVDRGAGMAPLGPLPPGFTLETAVVRLVDLSGQVLRTFEVDNELLRAGVEQGLVVERGGRIYLADERGVRAVAVGQVLGVVGPDLVVVSCDDEGTCAIERQPVDGRPPRRLRLLGDIDPSADAIADAGGRLALLSLSGPDQPLVVLAADGQTLATVDAGSTVSDVPLWLPGDLGVVTADAHGIHWVRRLGSDWVVAPVPPPLDEVHPAVMFLIEW